MNVSRSIFTEGDTLDELRDMIRDAVRCKRPQIIRMHLTHDEVLTASGG